MAHLRSLVAVVVAALVFGVAAAQFQPRNVECIAPANPGGGWDFTCRVPAKQVMESLDLVPGTLQVTNLSGGGGGVAYANVVTQRNDDENLIVAASTATATRLAQDQYAGFSADQVRWLGAVGADFGAIAVSTDSEYATLDALVSAMTAAPGSINFVGGSAPGGWDHLKVLLLAEAAGIDDLRSIPYIAFDNGGAAMIEVIGGRADAFTGDVSEVLGQVEAGEMRVLGILAPERISVLPDVPTAQESGYDVVGANWRAFYAPGGISDAAYDYWVDAVRQVADSELWSQLRDQNGLAPFALFGGEFETFVNQQVAQIQTISRDLGLIQ